MLFNMSLSVELSSECVQCEIIFLTFSAIKHQPISDFPINKPCLLQFCVEKKSLVLCKISHFGIKNKVV